jgi:hypothetical protein
LQGCHYQMNGYNLCYSTFQVDSCIHYIVVFECNQLFKCIPHA